jgi:hypothetical protein
MWEIFWQVHIPVGMLWESGSVKISLVIFALFIPFLFDVLKSGIYMFQTEVARIDRFCFNFAKKSGLITSKHRPRLTRGASKAPSKRYIEWTDDTCQNFRYIPMIIWYILPRVPSDVSWGWGGFCDSSHHPCSVVDFMIWNYNYSQNGNSQDYYYLHWNFKRFKGKKKGNS